MTEDNKKLVEILNKFGNDFDIMQESEAISLCADGIFITCKLLARIKELEEENKKLTYEINERCNKCTEETCSISNPNSTDINGETK